GAGNAENRDAIFRRANWRDQRVQFVLTPPPGYHVHRWDDDGLRSLPDQRICHARVAQIVTDTQPELSPRRVPYLLFGRRQAVLEELDRHTLDLPENDFTGRPDDVGRVVKIGLRCRILAAGDQVAVMLSAPRCYFIRDRSVEGVFTEHEQLSLR